MAALNARSLIASIDGADITAQAFTVSISADDADTDDVTYAEAAAGGGRQYTLNLTLTQDMAADTGWSKIFSEAGTDVPVLIKPYGNATASATQPHFSGTVSIREPNGVLIGGDADATVTARQKIEVEWPFTAKPTKVTS